jgi:hypothetical protein
MDRRIGQFLVIVISLILTATVFTATFASEPSSPGPDHSGLRSRGKQTIYVDTSAIDARDDLTDQQKTDLKDLILKHLKDNLESAVGEGNADVTNDPAKKAGASRTVDIKNTLGDGAWGDWPYGSKSVNVYLKEFMDDKNVAGSFQTNGDWNISKLGNALGHTSGHEVGHSFSVGHNNNTGNNTNKITKGGNIGADKRATFEWNYDEHTKKVINENWDKPPCASAVDYESKALAMHYGGEPSQTGKPDEFGGLDTLFMFEGALATEFNFGLFGEDTDNGALDGDPDFDFIYKSSMLGDGTDAQMITFIEGAHDYTQFLVEGAEGTEYAGQWFVLDDADLTLDNFGPGPNSVQVADNVLMEWDIDGDSNPDIIVTLDTNAWGDKSNTKNGFTYDYTRPTFSLLDAYNDGIVSLDIVSTGAASGYIATITVTSTIDAPFKINIADSGLPGMVLVNENEEEQDEIISKIPGIEKEPGKYTPATEFPLEPSTPVTLPVNGYCINMEKDTPSKGANFTLSPTSNKIDVNEVSDVHDTLENYTFPDNLTDSDVNKIKQIVYWMSDPANSDKTADDFTKIGYPIEDRYVPYIKDILNKSGQNPEDLVALTGEGKTPEGNESDDDDEKEPSSEEDICFTPGFESLFLIVGILVAIMVAGNKRFNGKRKGKKK